MRSLYLGILRGYSDSTSNKYGNFKMYFKYESITRKNNGNSSEVVFKNCYIYAKPAIEDKRWTSNTLYIDHVYISDTKLDIEESWKGNKYSYTDSNGEKHYVPNAHTTKKVTITEKFSIGDNETTITLRGHRSGQSEKAQEFKKKLEIPSGWGTIGKPTINEIKDNGNNTVTIKGKTATSGKNNSLSKCTLYYTTDGTTPSSTSKTAKSVSLTSTSGASYTKNIKLTSKEQTQVKAIVYGKGTKGDISSCGVKSKSVKYYSKPGTPKNLKITSTGNTVTITATKGSNGSNNPAKGVEIYYIRNKKDPSKREPYTSPFTIDKNESIEAIAKTIGTYTGNSNAYYYSNEIGISTNVDSYSNPGKPTIAIEDNNNNTYSFKVTIGDNGNHNPATGVEIYYTTDGSEPNSSSTCIDIAGLANAQITFPEEGLSIEADTTIKAFARTKGKAITHQYSVNTAVTSSGIKYYQSPTIYKPIITFDRKLTKKSIITIDQDLHLYKNSKFVQGKIGLYKDIGDNMELLNEYELSNSELSINIDTLNNSLSHQDVELSIIDQIDLSEFNIQKDDYIYIKTEYNIQNGKHSTNLVDNTDDEMFSDRHLVESSGIMHIKVDEQWVEGQVWIKADNEWHEATDVFVKVNGQWCASI